MGWQADTFKRLRDREWHTVGELFEAVQAQIPLHHAMRHVMHPSLGREDLPGNSTARWYYFLQGMATIGVETTGAKNRRKYADKVRLRYVTDRTCEHCGGPVIRASWSAHRAVACLACEAPGAETGSPPATMCPGAPGPAQTPIVAPPQPKVTRPTIIIPSPGWQYNAKRAFAAFVKHTRLPFLSVSQVFKGIYERPPRDVAKFLMSRGKLPLTPKEVNHWYSDYVRQHPP